jgi:hypothetical protein
MQGWSNPKLIFTQNEWRIYSNCGHAFVSLFSAPVKIIDACQGAREKLAELDNKPF